jgi:hypothetical protein
MKITLVKQKHKHGCGIACLSMVTGKDYDDIVKDFINDFDEEGMTTYTLIEWLGDYGFSVLFKEIRCYVQKDFARAYMLKPFTEIHIISLKWKADTTHHFVVMDKDGKLFCPSGSSDEDLRNSYLIDSVVGLYPPQRK